MDKKQKYKITKKVRQTARSTIQKYNLIQPNDSVLLGLSGGKDSWALLDILSTQNKIPESQIKVFAVHVDVLNIDYTVNSSYLKGLCNKAGVEYIHYKTEIDLTKDPKKSPCFICSWFRRKSLFTLAEKFSCNKVALGHNMDDAVETLLLNMVNHGSISSIPPIVDMRYYNFKLIRPLLHLTNEQLQKYAQAHGFIPNKTLCKYDDNTKRKEMNILMQKMKMLNPTAIQNLFKSTGHIISDYLPFYSANDMD